MFSRMIGRETRVLDLVKSLHKLMDNILLDKVILDVHCRNVRTSRTLARTFLHDTLLGNMTWETLNIV